MVSEATKELRPGLLLGLGDLGREVVWLVQRRLAHLYQRNDCPPFLSCLWLRLTEKSEPGLIDFSLLESGEPRHPPGAWWYPGLSPGLEGRVHRLHGRWLLTQSVDFLRDALRQAEARSRDIVGGLNPVDLSQPTNVYLVSRLNTLESGLVTDLATVVRHTFGTQRVNLQAYLVPPEENPDAYAQRRAGAELYAFLKELNWLSLGGEPVPVDWYPGPAFSVSRPLFDHCFFPASHCASPAELAQLIVGDFSPGPFPAYRRSVRINLRSGAHRAQTGARHQRLSRRFGRSQIGFLGIDHELMQKVCALRLAEAVTRAWSGPAQVNEAEIAKILADLRQRLNQQELLAALLDPRGGGEAAVGRGAGLDQRFYEQKKTLLAEFKLRGCDLDYLVEQASLLTSSLEHPTSELNLILAQNRDAVVERLSATLEQCLEANLRENRLSLDGCHTLLSRLQERIGRLEQALKAELKRAEEQVRTASLQAQHQLRELAHQCQRSAFFQKREHRALLAAENYLDSRLALNQPLGSLQSLLRLKILALALEALKALVQRIEGDDQTLGRNDGLSARLQMARDYLVELADQFQSRRQQRWHQLDSYLTVNLTAQVELDQAYAHYIQQPEQVAQIGVEILQRLGRGLLDITRDRARGQEAQWEEALLRRCQSRFEVMADDYHILRRFFAQPLATAQAQVRQLIEACRQGLASNSGAGHLVVGLATVESGRSLAEQAELKAFQRQLCELIQSQCDGEVQFLTLNQKAEFLFYHEVGGVTLAQLFEVRKLWSDYELFLAAGEPLHLDSRREELPELIHFTPQEGQALEESLRAFVIGQLLGIVEVQSGEFFWNYRRQRFLKRRPLGKASRALARLTRDQTCRRRLLAMIDERLEKLYQLSSPELLARAAVALNQAKIVAFGSSWGQVSSVDELPYLRRLEVQAVVREEERLGHHPAFEGLDRSQLESLMEQVDSNALTRNEVGRPVLKFD